MEIGGHSRSFVNIRVPTFSDANEARMSADFLFCVQSVRLLDTVALISGERAKGSLESGVRRFKSVRTLLLMIDSQRIPPEAGKASSAS